MKQTLDEQKDILRKYLLHGLAEPEQEQVEMMLLTRRDFDEYLAIAEQDLIDDFVAGRLSEAQMQSFREHYITTPERLQKLKFARTLAEYVSRQDSPPVFLKFLLFFRMRPLQAAFTVAGSLLIVAAIALFVMSRLGWWPQNQRPELRAEFVRVNRAQDTDSVPLSELMRGSKNTPVLVLRQNLVREGTEPRRIEITSGVSLVRLLLEVPSGLHDSYEVTLETTDGREMASIGELKARDENGARFVVVNIPAQFITRGDYRLKLVGMTSDGRAMNLGLYPFQLLTRETYD